MFAAVFAAAEAAAQAAEHGTKKTGLPQLNTHDYAPQLFWLVVTFTLLYFVLARVALPRVGEVLEERKNRIARDLEAAARLRSETDKALAEYEQALATARSNASAVAKDARDKSATAIDVERGRVEGELAKRLTEAEKRIGETKLKALQSVETIAADTASAVVEKLIGQNVSVDEARKAIAAGR